MAPTRSPLNLRSRGQSIEFEGQNIQRPSFISMDDYEDEEHHQNRNNFNAQERQKIQKWLSQIKTKMPKSFDSGNENIQEFRDG